LLRPVRPCFLRAMNEGNMGNRLIAAGLLVACTASCAHAGPIWFVPAPNETAGGSQSDTTFHPPEATCTTIRENAIDRYNGDTWGGAVIAGLGLLGFAPSLAMSVQANHDPGYYAWTAGAVALSALVIAGGTFLLIRGGSDRQEFFAMNGAVAQAQADYAQYPTTDTYRTMSNDALQKEVARLAAEKTDAQRDQTYWATQAVIRDGQLTAVQGLQLKLVDALPKPDPSAKPAKPAPSPSVPDGSYFPANPTAPAKSLLDAASEAHGNADGWALTLANRTKEWTFATNALTARQMAWTHCGAAITAIAGVDAAAANALSAAAGAAAGNEANVKSILSK
jgi:hypothetical protein